MSSETAGASGSASQHSMRFIIGGEGERGPYFETQKAKANKRINPARMGRIYLLKN